MYCALLTYIVYSEPNNVHWQSFSDVFRGHVLISKKETCLFLMQDWLKITAIRYSYLTLSLGFTDLSRFFQSF